MIDLSTFTEAERRRLEEFIHALRTPCKSEINPDSELCNEEFESEFRSKLLIHHCFIGSPLFQESFDSAFISACRNSGRKVEIAPPGQRFWDVEVDGKKISLKSTKAKNLSEDTLHISKLTEAAWIQDCRTAAKRYQYTMKLFKDYCNEINSIIQLRYFAEEQKYELVEIPVNIFTQVFNVGRSHFSSDGPTINIPIGKNPPDFTLKLDRSDAKITITKINKKLCTVHATWEIGDSF